MKHVDRKLNAVKIEKSWGYELIRVNNKEQDYCSKILFIRDGGSTSMHYHIYKHETFYVRKGTLRIDTLDTEIAKVEHHIVKEGEVFEIDRYLPHQLIAAYGDVEFDETSTYSCTTDSHRVYRNFKELFEK